jgi:allantoinase
LDSRPARAEQVAIGRALVLAEATGCSLHVVHVSSGGGAALVAEARARGGDVTCETCPHYLVLTAEDVERIGAAAKCAPPIRDTTQREALWSALRRGDIAFVASDHSPAPRSLKESPDFFHIWGGIAGVQTTLGLMLQEGHGERGVPLPTVIHWLTAAPARRFGLTSKGRIEVGVDADLTLVDLSSAKTLEPGDLRYRHAISPYLGRQLTGTVRQTLVRGQTVRPNARPGRAAGGRLVRPTRAGA